MAKFYGAVGFARMEETSPDVWKEVITEHEYYGDVYRNMRRLQNSSSINDNIAVTTEISIVADPYANQHFYDMRYVVYQGVKWKVDTADIQYPRIVMTLGGIYNG